jgi:hypothetical protein
MYVYIHTTYLTLARQSIYMFVVHGPTPNSAYAALSPERTRQWVR